VAITWSPEVKRLAAMLADHKASGDTHVTFLLNFFDEAQRRAPVAK